MTSDTRLISSLVAYIGAPNCSRSTELLMMALNFVYSASTTSSSTGGKSSCLFSSFPSLSTSELQRILDTFMFCCSDAACIIARLQVSELSMYPTMIERRVKSGSLVRFSKDSNNDTTEVMVRNGNSSFSSSTRGNRDAIMDANPRRSPCGLLFLSVGRQLRNRRSLTAGLLSGGSSTETSCVFIIVPGLSLVPWSG